MKQLLKIYFETDRNYKISLVCAAVTLFFVIWFSTGTLSPYALSAPADLVINQYSSFNPESVADPVAAVIQGQSSFQCRYVSNIDHAHYLGAFLMLDGADKKFWGESVVLRRILYPLITYPFMKLMGFEVGGIVANFFIHLTAFFLFISFVRREIGREAAIFTAWVIAVFPGVAYFGGLPYAYAFIVPGCLISTILLWNLSKASELKSVLLLSLGLGITFLAYDFLPTFGFAAVFILVRRKMFSATAVAVAAMIVPAIISNLILKNYYEVNLINSNTEMYKIIGVSYLGIFSNFFSSLGIDSTSSLGMFLQENAPYPDLAKWLEYIKYFPVYFLFNYIFSTFGYLSIAFAILNIPKLFGQRLKFNSLEFGVLLAVLLLFAFNNLAPPYRSWQMREYNFARIYEPIFVVMILYIARKIQTLPEISRLKQKILLGICGFVIIGNAITSFSTIIPNNWGLGIYGNFYLISFSTTKNAYSSFKTQIKKYGKYPIGFCAPLKNANDAGKQPPP